MASGRSNPDDRGGRHSDYPAEGGRQAEDRYLLSGWIKTQGVEIVGARWDPGAISLLRTERRKPPSRGWAIRKWTYVTLCPTRRTDGVVVAVRLGLTTAAVTGTAWYDDLCLIELDGRLPPAATK